MNNRPPLAGYPPPRGYGLDSSRLIAPYQAHGIKPFYPPPNVGSLPSSVPSPYRIEAMQSAERRHHSDSVHEGDEMMGSSDEDSREVNYSNHSHGTLISNSSPNGAMSPNTSASRGKKRTAPNGPIASTSRKASNTATPNKTTSSTASKARSSEAAQRTPPDSSASVDGQKRKKKAVSCEGCRRRKLKCDRGWPCGACRDRDEAHLCSWEGGTRPQGTGRDQENVPLLARMDKMEMLLGKIADRIGINGPPNGNKNESNPSVPVHSATDIATPSSSVLTNTNVGAALTVRQKGPPGSLMRGMNVSLLPTAIQPNTNDEMAAELLDILKAMPDTASIRKMCHCFFDEVNWMHYAVDEDNFWQKLCEQEEIRTMIVGESTQIISTEHVRSHLQFLALTLCMCGFALLYSDESDFPEVGRLVGLSPAYGPFFDSAQRALSATNPFDEPTLMSFRVLILLIWAIGCVRGPASGNAVQAMTLSQLQALELDIEPAASMPKAQARDRIRLFHTFVVMDWFGAGTVKRNYFMREEPIKHPYLFARQNVKEGLSEKDGFLLPDMWLKLEVARINRRAADRSAMTEEEAYSTTLQLQEELDEIFSDLPPEFENEIHVDTKELDIPRFHRLAVLMLVANQLINLHKRYYIQGWLNPVFRTSRDICFSSARRICLLFRKTFSHAVPMDTLMTMDVEQMKRVMDGRQKLTSKLWYFAHSSVGACLLLQHHYALMDVHPDAAGPNADKVRAEIIDDLRYTRRLLLAMSARSQIARSGIAVLARPELACSGGAEASNFNHADTMHHRSRHASGTYDPDGSIGDEESARRAELAKDLQSITDHDSFATKRFKMHGNDDFLNFRSRRHNRPANNSEIGTGTTPRSVGTPGSSSSVMNVSQGTNGQSNKFGAPNGEESQQGSSQFVVPFKPQPRTPGNGAQRTNPAQTNGLNNSHAPHLSSAQLSDMEAFLESALSTDFTTGLPVAPEVSFERSADRIGGTQPFASNGVMRPLSPFTSAFLGNWDAFQSNPTAQNTPNGNTNATMPNANSGTPNGGQSWGM
ncbi:uncharacterized protein FA14DRAFT_189621 [Meira miltonrushii]|uniref:Zn(2)-C6 fungal-type domain-containing protein n=1 Tax=Meira miltonrushii TaxID=1280837 RepID=A0A316VDN3_9BASI|nr:uncharacterized protein FA14DRAFT_189621 [Meira miltonrushii]PWN35682.1 hypothetical protein FA14DRAFT_189621 [Meira miltonrushii]